MLKYGFALLKTTGKSTSYSEEILAISEIESELLFELEKYNAENKSAFEKYTKTLLEIELYFQKYSLFTKSLAYFESKRGSGNLKRQNYFKDNPIPESLKNYLWLDGEYLLYTSELEYPPEYIIREFGFNKE